MPRGSWWVLEGHSFGYFFTLNFFFYFFFIFFYFYFLWFHVESVIPLKNHSRLRVSNISLFFFFLTNIMHFEHWHRQKCRELAHITSLYLNKNFCCMNILHNSCPIKDTTLRWVATCQMLFHRNSNPNLTLYAL